MYDEHAAEYAADPATVGMIGGAADGVIFAHPAMGTAGFGAGMYGLGLTAPATHSSGNGGTGARGSSRVIYTGEVSSDAARARSASMVSTSSIDDAAALLAVTRSAALGEVASGNSAIVPGGTGIINGGGRGGGGGGGGGAGNGRVGISAHLAGASAAQAAAAAAGYTAASAEEEANGGMRPSKIARGSPGSGPGLATTYSSGGSSSGTGRPAQSPRTSPTQAAATAAAATAAAAAAALVANAPAGLQRSGITPPGAAARRWAMHMGAPLAPDGVPSPVTGLIGARIGAAGGMIPPPDLSIARGVSVNSTASAGSADDAGRGLNSMWPIPGVLPSPNSAGGPGANIGMQRSPGGGGGGGGGGSGGGGGGMLPLPGGGFPITRVMSTDSMVGELEGRGPHPGQYSYAPGPPSQLWPSPPDDQSTPVGLLNFTATGVTAVTPAGMRGAFAGYNAPLPSSLASGRQGSTAGFPLLSFAQIAMGGALSAPAGAAGSASEADAAAGRTAGAGHTNGSAQQPVTGPTATQVDVLSLLAGATANLRPVPTDNDAALDGEQVGPASAATGGTARYHGVQRGAGAGGGVADTATTTIAPPPPLRRPDSVADAAASSGGRVYSMMKRPTDFMRETSLGTGPAPPLFDFDNEWSAQGRAVTGSSVGATPREDAMAPPVIAQDTPTPRV